MRVKLLNRINSLYLQHVSHLCQYYFLLVYFGSNPQLSFVAIINYKSSWRSLFTTSLLDSICLVSVIFSKLFFLICLRNANCFFSILRNFCCSHVLSMVFTASFYRATFLLTKISSSPAGLLTIIPPRRLGCSDDNE